MLEVRGSRDIASEPRADRAPGGSPTTSVARGVVAEPSPEADGALPRSRRLAWADLLRRVFAVDVLECSRCGGRLRLLATIHAPDATEAILECLELPSRAPPTAVPRPEVEASGAQDLEAGA